MKSWITAALLGTTLFTASASLAASYEDRAMATGAVVGATTGAVAGSGYNQAVEGAIFGAILGTVAGAVIASRQQPVYVVTHRPRPHYRPVRHRHESRRAYSRPDGHRDERRKTHRGHDRRGGRH